MEDRRPAHQSGSLPATAETGEEKGPEPELGPWQRSAGRANSDSDPGQEQGQMQPGSGRWEQEEVEGAVDEGGAALPAAS